MINIAILGFGVVGSGVAEVIELNREEIKEKLGDYLYVKYILDIRDFKGTVYADRVIRDISVIVNDPTVSAVVEAMGGTHPAYEFSLAALMAGKHVITSNKETVATLGDCLLRAARDNNVGYMFEASVGGGIPIIRPMIRCLSANKINSIVGILNGTTNYILTQMRIFGKSFEISLSEAQTNGYAERDPSADINGIDTCRKICILTDIANGKYIDPNDVYTEGISNIRTVDFKNAEKYGATIKLLGRAQLSDKGISVIVCPFLIKNDDLISGINDVYNGIELEGNAVGKVTFCGKGAGKLPTASAIIADIIDAIKYGGLGITWGKPDQTNTEDLIKLEDMVHAFYVDFQPNGVCVSDIEKMIGKAEIITREDNSVVLVTDAMKESLFCENIKELEKIGVKVNQKIRVFR